MEFLQTYPNQKILTLRSCEHDGKNKKNPYGMISVQANNKAMKELTFTAYKMWVTICLNQNGRKFGLSKVQMTKQCGISPTSYVRVVKQFIRLGYMKKIRDLEYEFYEMPIAVEDSEIVEEWIDELVNDITGCDFMNPSVSEDMYSDDWSQSVDI